MCGIIAVTSSSKEYVSKILHNGLKKLEYRGYDSVGIATIDNETIHILKDAGTIDKVSKRLDFESLKGSIGIGHNRWATHGQPNQENAHPHIDCTGSIAIVHNGIIENYRELKTNLLKNNHHFSSDTDSEVIVHLMEEELNQKRSLFSAFKHVIAKLEGTYAIALMCSKKPNTLFLAKKDSPLVIGIQEDTKFAASDISSFLEYTKKIVILKNNEIAVLTPTSIYIEKDGSKIHPKCIVVSWTAESAQKSGYPHFMLKEIHEQPIALKNTLNISPDKIGKIANEILKADRIIFMACGTSYHAALSGFYHFQRILGKKPVYAIIASEYESYSHLIDENTLIIAISQSGETLDVIKALTIAQREKAKIITLSNVIDSSIPRISHFSLYTKAGPEIGVAATKTYITQLGLLTYLSLRLEYECDFLNTSEFNSLFSSFVSNTPKMIRTIINRNEFKAKRLASIISNRQNSYFLARGFNIPIAMEGALKLKEVSYIHAEAYPAGESKHGPISIIDSSFPVIMIAPNDQTAKKIIGNAEEMRARGAYIISVTHNVHKIIDRSDYTFLLPQPNHLLLNPIIYVIPLQLLAYFTAIHRGFNPDKPKNLAKTVTVE